LWIDTRSRSYAGVLHLNPGAAVGVHAHRYAVHHVWVTEGDCLIEGRRLGPGSYVFVPAGTDHGIEKAGPDGCTLFYLYLRAAMD
jgi:quercetin dioxygenase-like cupin family protein